MRPRSEPVTSSLSPDARETDADVADSFVMTGGGTGGHVFPGAGRGAGVA